MLKIKDNVDLKELEKFNFEYDEDNDYWFYYGFTEPNDQSEVRYYIDNKDRRISVGFDMYVNPYRILDKIYDLIQAGLVEKEQLMNKQELIKKLEHDNVIDTEEVKRLEAIRRNTTSKFYKSSYQKKIHALNAKRELRKEILEFLEKE